MRTSEVFALTWDDIDFEEGTIFIQHSVYNKPKDHLGRWFLGSTKTISGTRKIYMSDTLKKALLNYKDRQDYLKLIYESQYKYYHLEDVKNEYGKVVENRIVINTKDEEKLNLIFTKDDGTYIGTDILKYPFKIIHNELKINSRFYDLRGTYATKILNNGTELKDVANILGHSNVITTENYYIRSLSDNRRNATEIADKVINSQVINNVIEFKVGESV